MLDMHLQHSQTGYLSVVSSLLEIRGSRRESGLVNNVGAAATAPYSHWKSLPLLLVCVHWWKQKRPKATESRLWAALAPNFKDLWETMMHILVHSDCSSVLKRNGGDMAQFSKETGWSFEFGGRRLVRKQPNCWLHLGFQIMLIDPSFITCQHFSGQFWMASVELSQHELAPLNPNPLLFVNERGTHIAHLFLTWRWSCGMDMVTAVPMLWLSWISWFVTLALTIINFSTTLTSATVTAVAGVPHWC